MGAKSAKLKSRESSRSSIETETPSTSKQNSNLEILSTYFMDKFVDANFSMLDDLLVDILSHVSAKDLINNCRLVCKEWKDIIDGHSVWKIKCQRENKCIPAVTFNKIPERYYEKIYIHNPFGRNLLQNPCGEDGLNSWVLMRTGGDGFRIEKPPQGADPVPDEVGSQSCFATTYVYCVKYQLIDLLALGIPEEILQLKTTKIQIGEWYAARFDCSSEYRLNVSLLDKHHTDSNDLPVEEPDSFEFSYTEEQWIGKQWHKITHTFENVGKTKYVYFQHFGKDRQFWAGHYGSKMTGAFVKVFA